MNITLHTALLIIKKYVNKNTTTIHTSCKNSDIIQGVNDVWNQRLASRVRVAFIGLTTPGTIWSNELNMKTHENDDLAIQL